MISGLTIDPRNPDVVLATYTDGSVFLSQDGGDSWSKLAQGPRELFGLVVLPD
jgi:hypothetical protein